MKIPMPSALVTRPTSHPFALATQGNHSPTASHHSNMSSLKLNIIEPQHRANARRPSQGAPLFVADRQPKRGLDHCPLHTCCSRGLLGGFSTVEAPHDGLRNPSVRARTKLPSLAPRRRVQKLSSKAGDLAFLLSQSARESNNAVFTGVAPLRTPIV